MISAAAAPPSWVKALSVPVAIVTALLTAGAAGMGAFFADSVTVHNVTVQQIGAGTPGSVTVLADADNVEIVAGTPGKVVVEQITDSRALTRALAQRAARSQPIPLWSAGGGQVIVDDRGGRRPHGPADRRLLVQVPPAANLVVRGGRGEVSVAGTSGNLDVNVQAGDVRLDDATVTGVTRVQTTFGHIAYSGVLKHGDLDLEVVDGSVQARLPLSTNAHLEASAARGHVSIDPAWPVAASRRPGHPTAGSASGDLGSGADGTVTLSAGTGSVQLDVR